MPIKTFKDMLFHMIIDAGCELYEVPFWKPLERMRKRSILRFLQETYKNVK